MTLSHLRTGRFLLYDDGASLHIVELPVGASHLGYSTRSILPLDGAGVARRHATVVVTPAGEVDLHDDHSPTGTWVDGERVWHHRLRPGEHVRAGNATLTFMTG